MKLARFLLLAALSACASERRAEPVRAASSTPGSGANAGEATSSRSDPAVSRASESNDPRAQIDPGLAGQDGSTAAANAAVATQPQAPSISPRPAESTAPPAHVELGRERALVDESVAALKASDYASARAKASAAIDALLSRPEAERGTDWLDLLNRAGSAAWSAQDAHAANRAWRVVLDVRTKTLPDDHVDLQKSRGNFALTLRSLGDLQGARALQEKVLEVFSRTLPDDDAVLQQARGSLALTIGTLGDLQRCRALQEKVLEVYSRTLPDDRPEVQKARGNLAITMRALGDSQGARAILERVLESFSRTLPDDHPDLQKARLFLAIALYSLGDFERARALQEKALESLSRTLPDDHPDLQKTRLSLAITMCALGEFQSARAIEERALELFSHSVPDDHPDVQLARQYLAATLYWLDDFQGCRALEEKVLEVYSRTLADDHANVQAARLNLAAALEALGDSQGACALEGAALEVLSRTLPEDHPDLQKAREHLALTLAGLAATDAGSHGDEAAQSERTKKRKRCAELIGAQCRALVGTARAALLTSSSREAQSRCAATASDLSTAVCVAIGADSIAPLPELDLPVFVLSETTRAAALESAALMRLAAQSSHYGELRSELSAASDELAHLAHKGTSSEEFQHALERRDAIERELVALSRELDGARGSALDFDMAALAKKLSASEALVTFRAYTRRLFGRTPAPSGSESRPRMSPSVECLAAFVVRPRRSPSPSTAERTSSEQSPAGSTIPASSRRDRETEDTAVPTLVDLGPIAPIEDAVRAWRASIGSTSGRGSSLATQSPSGTQASALRLRMLVLDPLLPALTGADHLVVLLDDVLHLVPFDALPDGTDGASMLGDRWRIETRASLSELLDSKPRSDVEATTLLAVGGVRYDASASRTVDEGKDASSGRGADRAGILEGTPWAVKFSDLPATRDEVEEIARGFTATHSSEAKLQLLEESEATRQALFELARSARWLHVATHGWFARESIRSWKDPDPIDKLSGWGLRPSGEQVVTGMSPLLLCGLALADANLPENSIGRVPGLITAEEISTLDLSHCELAVLSACDTNVGERRAGQGVASLQMALQMAGAHSVITSLWKVPDVATRELMVDFYRRMWVEKKPKWRALWEAKKMIRDAKDDEGRLKYTTRDWAAWVLTGDPN